MKVFVINGFLGSGKTSFLKNVLRQMKDYKIACVVNEFGQVNLDAKIKELSKVQVQEITNGSVFCTCKYDQFIDVMLKLCQKNFDYILIETSGFSDPRAFEKALLFLKEKDCDIEPLRITLIDAKTFLKMSKILILLNRQVSCSDLIIVNKCDLVTKEYLKVLTDALKKLNKEASFLYTKYGRIEMDELKVFVPIKHDLCGPEAKNLYFKSCTIFPDYQEIEPLRQDLLKLKELVYRVKGYCKIQDVNYQIDLAGDELYIKKSEIQENELVVLYDLKCIGKSKIESMIRHKEKYERNIS